MELKREYAVGGWTGKEKGRVKWKLVEEWKLGGIIIHNFYINKYFKYSLTFLANGPLNISDTVFYLVTVY